MKKIIFILLVNMFIGVSSIWALTFEVGSAAGVSVAEGDITQALKLGKGSVKGAKIVYKKGLQIPAEYRQTWMAKQLSGEEVPVEGDKSDNVVFITAF